MIIIGSHISKALGIAMYLMHLLCYSHAVLGKKMSISVVFTNVTSTDKVIVLLKCLNMLQKL